MGAESHVLVFQSTIIDWACSMLAIMRIGAVYVRLDFRNPAECLTVGADENSLDEASRSGLPRSSTSRNSSRPGAERVLQRSAMPFNHSSDQIYTGLVNGGSVPAEKRGDPMAITDIIRQYSITYAKATPSEDILCLNMARLCGE